jgi:quercetin dioxygenase-like cupin family protein
MKMAEPAFGLTDWSQVERVEKSADSGQVFWRTQQIGDVRVRMVEYTPGYVSDHWCTKGHVLLCLEGELVTELEDGRIFTLTPGVSYQVADNAEPHRSTSPNGAKLFIVD